MREARTKAEAERLLARQKRNAHIAAQLQFEREQRGTANAVRALKSAGRRERLDELHRRALSIRSSVIRNLEQQIVEYDRAETAKLAREKWPLAIESSAGDGDGQRMAPSAVGELEG